MRQVKSQTENPTDSDRLMSSLPETVVDIARSASAHKRVRFKNGGFAVEKITYDVPPASKMSEDEKSSIWWRDSDFYFFRKKSKMLAKELRRRERSDSTSSDICFESVMSRSYSVCCQTAEESNVVCRLSDHDRRRVEESREQGRCQRGLEKWIFPHLAMERNRRQRVAIRGVVEVQDRFVTCMKLDYDTGAEFMRKSSEQLTRFVQRVSR
jgi:hypothetical protein